MNELLLNSIYSLSGIAIVSASVLFIASKKFKVFEDPRIDKVEEALPAANCGGCGYPGCRNFAEAVVKSDDMSKLHCPVGGNEIMQKVALIMGVKVEEKEPTVAMLRCNGSRENAPSKIVYDGAISCTIAHAMFAGESGCAYGCLGLSDCVDVCDFGALYIDKESGLPVVLEEKCTSCGACVKACPRNLFELRPKTSQRIYVACMNKEKGAQAKKNCKVACIGCSRCVKFGDPEKVKVESFLCYIDPTLDIEKYGPEVAGSCPTNAIIAMGFEPKKPVPKAVPKKEENSNETIKNG